jgi:hypothetical protein
MLQTDVNAVIDEALETPVTVETAGPARSADAPTSIEIAALAYQLWEERGCQDGAPQQDWYEAERRLKARNSA